MNPTLAYCGLICDGCPIYWATEEKNPARQKKMRVAIADMMNQLYGFKLSAEDITDCDGCRADSGRIYGGCLNCPIRKCVREKSFETCAQCGEYPCENLKEFFKSDPTAKARLDVIREMI